MTHVPGICTCLGTAGAGSPSLSFRTPLPRDSQAQFTSASARGHYNPSAPRRSRSRRVQAGRDQAESGHPDRPGGL